MAVFHRCSGFQIRGSQGRQAHIRIPGDNPRGQYKGRYDSYGGGRPIRAAPAYHGAHNLGSPERQPRSLRPHTKAQRYDRVGMMKM